jgi:2-dehydro-3-deoxy-D-gluconate 5-dehydrogenase
MMSVPSKQPMKPIATLFDLTGMVALVTGAAMGIGQAIASRLAEAGAAVMIADVNDEAARATAARLNGLGYKAAATRANVAQVMDARAMVRETVAAFGRLDILVNNAGVYPFSPALQMTEEQWDRVLSINLKGAFFTAQAAAAHMVEAGHGGRIVNIASIDGLHPTGYLAHYDSSKGGEVMMTKALAKELGAHGIRVNAIAPGSIMTPGATAGSAAAQSSAAQSGAATAADYLARIPLGRMGDPDDIATVTLFLASDASAYMTGAIVVVDGGYLLS